MTDLRLLTQGYRPSDPVCDVKRRMIQHIVKNAGIEAGITHPYSDAKHISPHLFRHTIARHLKSAGYAMEFMHNFLGHASIETTWTHTARSAWAKSAADDEREYFRCRHRLPLGNCRPEHSGS